MGCVNAKKRKGGGKMRESEEREFSEALEFSSSHFFSTMKIVNMEIESLYIKLI
jgi:hypothetical protein